MTDDQIREAVDRIVDALNQQRDSHDSLTYCGQDIVIIFKAIRDQLADLVKRDAVKQD